MPSRSTYPDLDVARGSRFDGPSWTPTDGRAPSRIAPSDDDPVILTPTNGHTARHTEPGRRMRAAEVRA